MKKSSSTDYAVQETSTDALSSKAYSLLYLALSYAASIGYFEDPFIKTMAKSKMKKMYPIINRGTWSRVHAYRKILDKFATLPGVRQFVSFGAGMDTNYFYLRHKFPELKLRYVEVDFQEIITKKLGVIGKSPALSQFNGDPNTYTMIACDLRDLKKLAEEFAKAKVDPKLPTLILTECVLVYMDPASSQALVDWCGTYFDNAALLNYEMINPFDSFGKVMVENIEVRPLPEPTRVGTRLQTAGAVRIRHLGETEGAARESLH